MPSKFSSWRYLSHEARTVGKAFCRQRKFHISLERSMNGAATLATNLGGDGARVTSPIEINQDKRDDGRWDCDRWHLARPLPAADDAGGDGGGGDSGGASD